MEWYSIPEVLPAVSMSLASRKRASCNSRCGMLTSSFLSLVSILGATYCCLISVYAVAEGPLICKGNQDISSCDFTLRNLSSFHKLNFDLQWFTNGSCISTLKEPAINGTRLGSLLDGSFQFEISEELQRILHITTFVGLSLIGIIEILVSISQVAAGIFGCLCGTSKKKQNRTV